MSLLVMPEILGLFLNTLTADDKYSLGSSENFFPISKTFIKFWTFWKKDDAHRLYVFEIMDCERRG